MLNGKRENEKTGPKHSGVGEGVTEGSVLS